MSPSIHLLAFLGQRREKKPEDLESPTADPELALESPESRPLTRRFKKRDPPLKADNEETEEEEEDVQVKKEQKNTEEENEEEGEQEPEPEEEKKQQNEQKNEKEQEQEQKKEDEGEGDGAAADSEAVVKMKSLGFKEWVCPICFFFWLHLWENMYVPTLFYFLLATRYGVLPCQQGHRGPARGGLPHLSLRDEEGRPGQPNHGLDGTHLILFHLFFI